MAIREAQVEARPLRQEAPEVLWRAGSDGSAVGDQVRRLLRHQAPSEEPLLRLALSLKHERLRRRPLIHRIERPKRRHLNVRLTR